MIRSFYISTAGTMASQTGLDVTAHNLSNISTAGYRPQEVVFSSLLYNTVHDGDPTLTGQGAVIRTVERANSNFTPQQTGRELDFAFLEENVYFAIQTDEGVTYTCNGNFRLSQEEDGSYLVTDGGQYVLNADGERIQYTGTVPAFGAYSFENQSGLTRLAGQMFEESETSGAPQAVGTAAESGFLISSGVDPMTEMLDMMRFQRSFQMNTKMIQIADELTQTVNSLRG